MISFTGSTAVGKHIMAQRRRHAEARVPRARRQVGQHRPRRRRLRGAVRQRRAWCACTPGQGCAITTRMLLPRSRYDEGVEIAEDGVRDCSRTATRPTRTTWPGPLINARQRERVLGLHREGQGRGRAVRRRRRSRRRSSTRATSCSRRCSSTSTPTRRSRRRRSSARCSSVIPYDDDDDAVRIANNSRYGLSGAVNGRSLDRALRRRPPHPHRHGLGERRPVVRPRLAVRRLQGERPRPRARRRRLRGVPRDQDHRPPGSARVDGGVAPPAYAPTMATLILLRHGQSEWNLQNLFTGWVDVDLTAKGEAEAVRGGELLADAGRAARTSCTRRCRCARSAPPSCPSGPCGRSWIPVRRSWRLNERHYGALQGKDKKADGRGVRRRPGEGLAPLLRRAAAAARRSDPSIDARYADLPADVIPSRSAWPTSSTACCRTGTTASSPTSPPGGSTLVAAHGNSLRGLAMHLEGLTPRGGHRAEHPDRPAPRLRARRPDAGAVVALPRPGGRRGRRRRGAQAGGLTEPAGSGPGAHGEVRHARPRTWTR